MDKLPILHWPKKILYQLSVHRINSFSSHNERMLFGPSSHQIRRAFVTDADGLSSGSPARNVPFTGCNCHRSAHMTMLTPPKTRAEPSALILYVPCCRTAALSTCSSEPKSSADIMLALWFVSPALSAIWLPCKLVSQILHVHPQRVA